MATTQSAERAITAWLNGGNPSAELATIRRGSPDSMLESYGPHYILAYTTDDKFPVSSPTAALPDLWVNETRYELDASDRGWSGTGRRVNRYSATTDRHMRAVQYVLREEGYLPLDITKEGPNGHTYRLWTTNRCEWCEEHPVKFGQDYCSNQCLREARAEAESLYGPYAWEEPYYEPDTYSDADPGL